MARSRLSLLLFALFLTSVSGPLIACRDQSRTARTFSTGEWLEDLDFVVTHLKAHHPHLYYRISEEHFRALAAQSRGEIRQARSDLEAFLAIKRLVAGIRDGHTQLLNDGAFEVTDLRFPFRVDQFTDGVFITVIAAEHGDALGARVTAINGVPIQDVLGIAEPVARFDNEFGSVRGALTGLTFARMLQGLRLAEGVDTVTLDMVRRDGTRATLALRSVVDTGDLSWVHGVNAGPTPGPYVHPEALHLRHQGQERTWYWFEHLANEKALYFQLNGIADQPGNRETLARFMDRLWAYVDEHQTEVDKLIIDLRYNDGGNARRIIPFVNEILRHDSLNRRGRLFVLVGKRTYSAAVIFLTELVVHTNAIVLGDPPACPFNFFSDAVSRGHLPNSGFELMVASRQIDNAWSPDTVYYPPDIPAPFSSQDYFDGRDPALELALHGDTRTLSEIAAEEGADAALAHFVRQREEYADLSWWRGWDRTALERQVNERGYALMGAGDLASAFEVFKLNTLVFPESSNVWDSLGEILYHLGEYERSLASYRKSVALDPQNENGRRWIERIERERQSQLK